MTSRAKTNRPRVGDKVWCFYRFKDSKQPNGTISLIDWAEQEVLVLYYDDDMDNFALHEFEYMFDPSFGGTWCIGGNHPLLKPRTKQEQTDE
jgi:hypothetical protein